LKRYLFSFAAPPESSPVALAVLSTNASAPAPNGVLNGLKGGQMGKIA